MQFKQYLDSRAESVFSFSHSTLIPQPLIGALYDGRLHPGKLQAEMLYRIASALSLPMEDLLYVTTDSRPLPPPSKADAQALRLFRTEELKNLRKQEDLDYVLSVVTSKRIQQLYDLGKLPQALYLLALCDHLLTDHDLPLLEVCPLPRTQYFSPCYKPFPIFSEDALLPAFLYFGIAETDLSLRNPHQ